ncbi:MAG: F0F1 ATP synthase subunit A [Dehalococcoidia bacterium]
MKALLIAVAVLALMGAGMVFLKLPPPAIIVAPETVFHAPGLDITNTMFTSWVVVALLVAMAWFAGRGVRLVPSGFSAYVEAAVMAFYGIVEQVAGPVNARRFFPLVGTIFFFILISNYFGLLPMNAVIGVTEPEHGEVQAVFHQTEIAGVELAYLPLKTDTRDTAAGEHTLLPEGYEGAHHDAPADAEQSETHEAETHAAERTTDGRFSGILAPYFRSVMTDINAPLAIAIFAFVFVEFWGIQSLGMGYLGKFFAFGALKKGPLGLIDVFVGILELVSEFSRIVSFTFRLFGNIFAGEVLLLMMTFLVPFVLTDAFYGLELFVGLIQAFVFAMLTTVFAVTAVTHHGDEHHDEAHEEHGAHDADHAPVPAGTFAENVR